MSARKRIGFPAGLVAGSPPITANMITTSGYFVKLQKLPRSSRLYVHILVQPVFVETVFSVNIKGEGAI